MSDFHDRDIFDNFAVMHYRRANRSGLPDPLSADGDDYYAAWQGHLIASGVTFADADKASWRLAAMTGVLPGNHFGTLLALAREERRRREAAEAEAARAEAVGPDLAAARRAWDAMGDAERADRLASVRARCPNLGAMLDRWPGFAVSLAIDELAGVAVEDAPAPVALSGPAAREPARARRPGWLGGDVPPGPDVVIGPDGRPVVVNRQPLN